MTRVGEKLRSSFWIKVSIAVVALLVLLVIGLTVLILSFTGAAGGHPYTLEVKSGDTLAKVAGTLEQNRIVKKAAVLRFIMQQNGTAGRLQEGLYDLTGALNVYQVAKKLAGPARPVVVKITIPEGKRLQDLPPIFATAGFNAAAVRMALQDAHLCRYAQGTLEGFVFPATYEFHAAAAPHDMVKMMVARMEQEFTQPNVKRAKALHLNVYSWVTLASMVQAEAANDAQMPVIAGVFLNRLRDHIALGSDPTVAYGLGKNLPDLDRSAGDFLHDTPYSTYTRQGLPKGPINNPGRAALMSVLYPKRQLQDGRDALYFLHGRDGKIHVNHNYTEHLHDLAHHR